MAPVSHPRPRVPDTAERGHNGPMTTDSTAAPSTAAPSTAALSTAPGDPGASLAATRVKLGDFEDEIGPLGHLAAERERLASLALRSFEAVPLAATIGAEISGV